MVDVDHRRQRGFALLVAIGALSLSAVTVLLVSQHLQTQMMELHLEEREVTLVALGDAALAEALSHLAADPSFTGQPGRALGAGTISSRVRPGPGDLVLVTAEATFSSWRGRLEAEVKLSPAGPKILCWQRTHTPAG